MSLAAVLWDMDGLLVDSEPLGTIAERELAQRLGGSFTAEAKAAMVGTRLDVAVPLLLHHLGLPDEPDLVQDAADWLLARMVELFQTAPPLRPGAQALLEAVAAAAVPQVRVSSSYRVLVDAVLAHGVGPFAVTIAGDEVRHGKPHPEPYLTAAARLGVDAAACGVLEDSPSGAASGLAAGCAVMAVPSVEKVVFPPHPRQQVVASLRDVSVARLSRLVDLGAPLPAGSPAEVPRP
jgi:HAD superfamily hydrolase (TIGR01509 family)